MVRLSSPIDQVCSIRRLGGESVQFLDRTTEDIDPLKASTSLSAPHHSEHVLDAYVGSPPRLLCARCVYIP